MNELSIFDALFDDVFGTGKPASYRTNFATPRVDVKADEQGYVLEMDLPGRSENDVNIELDHNTLTISSKETSAREEKKDAKEEAKTNWIIRERRTSQFKRSFTLPDDVNGEAISATFKNGVLTLTMPRQELPAPKKILISAA
ncbi:MAG: Hsp20/alpha crystallin family protein [Treponema sp.]|nr:Hsp20/alpha crystallin family protein [Treponema sp.]